MKPTADAERRLREIAATLPKSNASTTNALAARSGASVRSTVTSRGMPDNSVRGIARRFVKVFGGIIGTLGVMTVANIASLGVLNRMFALLPRSISGLPGILMHPLLHASLSHFAMNSIGIVTLGGVVFLRSERDFWRVTAFATVFGGSVAWLIARPDYHVGASGVVFGYLGYLLTTGWFDRKFSAILLSLGAAALWGSALAGLSPLQQGVSWELHGAGLVAGIIAASWRRSRTAAAP